MKKEWGNKHVLIKLGTLASMIKYLAIYRFYYEDVTSKVDTELDKESFGNMINEAQDVINRYK